MLPPPPICVPPTPQVIQYQTVRYDVLPLSPASRNRLSEWGGAEMWGGLGGLGGGAPLRGGAGRNIGGS